MNDECRREKKDAGENLKLIGWLNQHQSTILRRRTEEVADYAQRELHFKVTKANIENLYKHLGIDLNINKICYPESVQQLNRAFDQVEKDFGLGAS